MSKYKFNPLKHGYEPISTHPELSYRFPLMDDVWFIKIIAYDDLSGLVYWYSALSVSVGLPPDDRVHIVSGTHDFRRPAKYEKQSKIHTNYTGLISSDEFAKELLKHLFGTTKNESVEKEGIERYSTNIGKEMRLKFNHLIS
jgi:hypothetical protein